jgi:hypothetical protein
MNDETEMKQKTRQNLQVLIPSARLAIKSLKACICLFELILDSTDDLAKIAYSQEDE